MPRSGALHQSNQPQATSSATTLDHLKRAEKTFNHQRGITGPDAAETQLTYRHVLSDGSLTPLNPLRVICLVDIDAAYAQFEMARLGLDKTKPIAVQQWKGLIAINYPAREFGITRHETAEEAKKKCPDLICVHVATYKEGETEAGYYEDARPETHKVSLEHYRRESVKILRIFDLNCPTIEKASIDEAFMDFTLPVREKLLERYPQLRSPPDDSPLGLDTPLPPAPHVSFDGLGHRIPVAAIDDLERGSDNLFSLPSTDDGPSWETVAISIGAELVAKCRTAVKDQLGYTCSAGIARNKTLAKLCAGWNKPDAQTILRTSAIAGFLRPLSFQKMRFLGGKLGNAIAEQYDAQSVGDLWAVSLEELQDRFGPDQGLWAWEILRGIDRSEVTRKTTVKSMVSSKNFRPSITTWKEGVHWLTISSVELYSRLTEARQDSPGMWPKTLCLHFRSDAYTSKSKQAAFPFTSNLSHEYILKRAERLLREFTSEKDNAASLPPCTNLTLAFQGLARSEKGQKGIEGFLGATEDAKPSASAKRPRSPTTSHDVEAMEEVTYDCGRCLKRIKKSSGSAETAAVFEAMRLEHEDWHFARDLMQSEKVTVGSTRPRKPDGKARPLGTLQSFFKKNP